MVYHEPTRRATKAALDRLHRHCLLCSLPSPEAIIEWLSGVIRLIRK